MFWYISVSLKREWSKNCFVVIVPVSKNESWRIYVLLCGKTASKLINIYNVCWQFRATVCLSSNGTHKSFGCKQWFICAFSYQGHLPSMTYSKTSTGQLFKTKLLKIFLKSLVFSLSAFLRVHTQIHLINSKTSTMHINIFKSAGTRIKLNTLGANQPKWSLVSGDRRSQALQTVKKLSSHSISLAIRSLCLCSYLHKTYLSIICSPVSTT